MKKLFNVNNTIEVYNFSINVFKDFVKNIDKNEIRSRIKGIESSEFKNYNTWTWIEPLIALNSRINQDDHEVKVKCRKRIKEVLDTGSALQIKLKNKVFQRILQAEELLDDEIQQAKINNDSELELEMVLKAIMQLVIIIEMGASEKYSILSAEKDLSDKIRLAEKLISENELG